MDRGYWGLVVTLRTPESILRQIISIYEDNYATSLATVESNWEDTDDIDLDDFITREITTDPTALDKQWLLPAMSVAIGPIRETVTEGWQQGKTSYDMQTMITYYLQHNDVTILAKIIARHIEATLDLFRLYPAFGWRGATNKIVPGSVQFIPSQTSTRGNAYVKGLMVQLDFRFLNYAA